MLTRREILQLLSFSLILMAYQSIPKEQSMSKKVIIIGGGSKKEYFTDDPEAEIWGLNGIRQDWVPRFDRMFNLHHYTSLQDDWAKGLQRDIEWANEHKDIPFYVIDDWPDVPHAKIFPRAEMEATRIGRPDYHAGSFDWMVAYAIFLGFSEIELHGIGLVGEVGEPLSARPCLEYWCGVAEGRDIKVTCAKDCDLFYIYHYVKTRHQYGYDDMDLVEDRTDEPILPKE